MGIKGCAKQRWGIDVGSHSLGLAAIDISDNGSIDKLLNCQVWLHDGGIDPNSRDTRDTRLAKSGIARRTRRMFRRRRQRLKKLDQFISGKGWPIVNHEKEKDPYLPWEARARLASETVFDADERHRLLSIALRHMARHRGWRSPYAEARSLRRDTTPSELFRSFVERVKEICPNADESMTTAELVISAGIQSRGIRRSKEQIKDKNGKGIPKAGLLGTKLMQSDNVRELEKIFLRQRSADPRLDDALLDEAIEHVFAAVSPKGSAAERVGNDALAASVGKTEKRALRASLAFQEFRMVSIIANLRIVDGGSERILSGAERKAVRDFLAKYQKKDDSSWEDVAEVLKIPRENLRGTAKETVDGEMSASHPPLLATERLMRSTKIKEIKDFWSEATYEAKEYLITMLSNAVSEKDDDGNDEVSSLLASLSEEQMTELDKIRLVSGRCAYSLETCEKLSKAMIDQEIDLQEARQKVFGVPSDWVPPAAPVGEPVGNPAVDRVLKQVARWLKAMDVEFGEPEVINIEHVRAGFMSDKKADELHRANREKNKERLRIIEKIQAELGIEGEPRRSDVQRFLALQRQHSECLYCGAAIGFEDMEMDHIVPRSGPGSNNRRENLAAVCLSCNRSKSNSLFSEWIKTQIGDNMTLKAAITRVRSWLGDPGESASELRKLKAEVISRLKRVSADPPLDDRSIESVAWMARELRRRIEAEFPNTQVRVYRGAITAEARKAGGIEKKINFIGGPGKTRFDRRHHAVDAAVVAMLSPYVAKTLKQRIDIRDAERVTRREKGSWKNHLGDDPFIYQRWQNNMIILADKLNGAIDRDQIPVWRPIRLGLGNSEAHEAEISKLDFSKKLSDELSLDDIDRASYPALWTALVSHPSFSWEKGLPAEPSRTIKVNNKIMSGKESLALFSGKKKDKNGSEKSCKAASIAVRGGSARLGDIHHARIYRIEGRKGKIEYKILRIFRYDLARFNSSDLFSVHLPRHAVSFRYLKPDKRNSITSGSAEYLGWIIAGDEIVLDFGKCANDPTFTSLSKFFPGCSRWHVATFVDERIKIRPAYLSKEGLENIPEELGWRKLSESNKMFDSGIRINVNKLFSGLFVSVIRRDSLAKPRWRSSAHLPVSWALE